MSQLTRAQAIRELGNGKATICLTVRYGKQIPANHEKYGGWRRIVRVSPSGIVTIVNSAGLESVLDLPAASLMEYIEVTGTNNGRLLNIYDRGLRPMTEEERIIISKTETMEYWGQQMILKKYGMEKLFKHNGIETYDYNTKMIRTPKVKGNLILQYGVQIG